MDFGPIALGERPTGAMASVLGDVRCTERGRLDCRYTDARGVNYVIRGGRVVHKHLEVRDAEAAGLLFGLAPNAYFEDALPAVRAWPEGRLARAARPGGELGKYTIYFDCLRNAAGREFVFMIGFGTNIKVDVLAATLREEIEPEVWEQWRMNPSLQAP